MTKEEHNCDNVNCNHNNTKGLCCLHNPDNCKYRQLQKENAELEEKISVLLSCKNCPESKGGYICVKEYENKCLAQKIQYIKELLEENAELSKELDYQKQARSIAENAVVELSRENAELKESGSVICDRLSERIDETVELKNENIGLKNQLTKAKDYILKLTTYLEGHTNYDFEYELIKEVKQFLKESEV